jgi:hypothetical protein
MKMLVRALDEIQVDALMAALKEVLGDAVAGFAGEYSIDPPACDAQLWRDARVAVERVLNDY